MSNLKTVAKKSLQLLAWILGIFFLVAVLLLTNVDWEDYREKEYYYETMNNIRDISFQNTEGEFWKVGWSNTNVTPSTPTTLVGYKPRGNYEFVQDSSFVKTLIIENGISTVAFLNYELLIVHPYLAQRVEIALREENLPVDFIYFTATHTHSGLGGYIPGPMGKIAFGGFDENIVSLLEQKTMEGIRTALSNSDTASVIFKKIAAESLVANRLKPEDPIDPYIRQIIFQKQNGEKGTLITFSAHATTLSSKFKGLSGDYPFYLSQALEKNEYDFALFASGTVGSHRPVTTGNQIDNTKAYARNLQEYIIKANSSDSKNKKKTSLLATAKIPIQLRPAHYRISENIRLRPWVFNWLFGDPNAHFDVVLLGNTLLIGSSGEISGVFMKYWEDLAEARGLNLIITTFNGGYIGYIIPDKYYNYPYHEARDMNLYGPYNGAYFNEMIIELIEKVSLIN